jgi:hypothetical protein
MGVATGNFHRLKSCVKIVMHGWSEHSVIFQISMVRLPSSAKDWSDAVTDGMIGADVAVGVGIGCLVSVGIGRGVPVALGRTVGVAVLVCSSWEQATNTDTNSSRR